MKKILVVDWLDKYGGAERVISSLNKVFSFDKCYAIIDIMKERDKSKIFKDPTFRVQQTVAKILGKRFRISLFFFPKFIKSLKIDPEADVIISSSHAVAKGVSKSNPSQLHISYFQARNMKYIWDDYQLYFGKFSGLLLPVIKKMRRRDIEDARQPDFIVSNSRFVQDWVKRIYNRESLVIYPPVDISNFKLTLEKDEYYVAVGRIEPYKRFDILVDAFFNTDKKLIIIGDGSKLKELKKRASSNIKFTGYLETDEVFKYVSKARGFIHAGLEDFGIAPIEAQACGTPVIAYGYGGVLETIIENETGVFFKEENKESLWKAVIAFENIKFDHLLIRENAERFKAENFERNIKKYIEDKIEEKEKTPVN